MQFWKSLVPALTRALCRVWQMPPEWLGYSSNTCSVRKHLLRRSTKVRSNFHGNLLLSNYSRRLPAVVLAGPNTPSGWTCKPLTQVDVSHEDCIQTSSYANGVWAINTQKVINHWFYILVCQASVISKAAK